MTYSTLKCLTRFRLFVSAFILATGIASLASAQTATAPKNNQVAPLEFEAKVVGVTDGDTITALTQLNDTVKIRIYGIDAPEKKQAFGSKSKEFLSSLVFGRTVAVRPMGHDIYGRTVGRVLVDGRDVGLTMCEYGFAWHYYVYAKKDTELRDAQSKAKQQQLGLWQDEKPIPPWLFRKTKNGEK
jgi:endonuclease YncB( thermonuclease family)